MLLSNVIKKHTRNDVTRALRKTRASLKNGNVYLLSKQSGKLSVDQIQAFKLSLRKLLKKQGKVWNFLLSYNSITKKPNETRLGKGKGNIKYNAIITHSGKALASIKVANSGDSVTNKMNNIKQLVAIRSTLRLKINRWIL